MQQQQPRRNWLVVTNIIGWVSLSLMLTVGFLSPIFSPRPLETTSPLPLPATPQSAPAAAPSRPPPHDKWEISYDTRLFEEYAHRCTDKTTGHKYQFLYAHVLHRFRHGGHSVEGGPQHNTKPFRMLEIGLGCDMAGCVAGGFRLMQKYLPNVEYFVFEYNIKLCRERFQSSGITAQEKQYLDRHLCEGSSGDPAALEACAKKFGPFDIIIDDASHMVEHVMTAYRFFFPSAYLNYGGVYVAEDLQTSYIPHYIANHHNAHMGIHVGNLIQYKLAADPLTGKLSGDVGFTPLLPETPHLAWLTQLVYCSQEVCAFEKVPQRPTVFPEGFPEHWKSLAKPNPIDSVASS